MPQLQINQGPQDALLYDNSRSYFTNVGYTRTSNFQTEYIDVESQNAAAFNSTVQFVIPKAADLLGPVDLTLDLPPCTSFGPNDNGGQTALGNGKGDSTTAQLLAGDRIWAQWVDEVGFAMIEKVTFSVGSNDIETITGEELQIRNELMTSDEMRVGYDQVLKTGKRAFQETSTGKRYVRSVPATAAVVANSSQTAVAAVAANPGEVEYELLGEIPIPPSGAATEAYNAIMKARRDYGCKDVSRLIAYRAYDGPIPELTHKGTDGAGANGAKGGRVIYAQGRQLCIPLGLFFTHHVGSYFPLAAIAGCNDIRIAIKFRPLKELVQVSARPYGTLTNNVATAYADLPGGLTMQDVKLRCQYVHVTGPEAQTLMNKEHVRLLKLYQHQDAIFEGTSGKKELSMDLALMHPVSTLLITIRRRNDIQNSKTQATSTDVDSEQKGFFFYHGDGSNPNYDRALNANNESLLEAAATKDRTPTSTSRHTIKVNSISLTLNGQERHPALQKGIETEYLRQKLLPMLHSNSNQVQKNIVGIAASGAAGANAQKNYSLQGSKNILVYPFSLNPEGPNPSGAVNFSKVSHAKLKIHIAETVSAESDADINNAAGDSGYQVDVYALYYNWLQIKDGRALLSFA